MAVGTATAMAALLAAVVTSRLVQRCGRERVTPPESSPRAGAGQVLVDPAELGLYARADPSPPADLTPAQGGVALAEAVRADHLAA